MIVSQNHYKKLEKGGIKAEIFSILMIEHSLKLRCEIPFLSLHFINQTLNQLRNISSLSQNNVSGDGNSRILFPRIYLRKPPENKFSGGLFV